MRRKSDIERKRITSPDDNGQEDKEVDGRGRPNNNPVANNNPNRNPKAPFAKNISSGQTAAGARIAAASDRRLSADFPVSDSNRGSFQSPDVNRRDNFDPFTSSEMSDPFGGDPFAEKSDVVVNSKMAISRNSVPVPPMTSLLDSMNDNVAPTNSFSFGTSNTSTPAFDPFGSSIDPFSSPPSRRASDFSNDFAGMSFPVASPSVPVPVSIPFQANTKVDDVPISSDNFFEAELLPVAPTSEAWSAPKNLVNLDFNAPPTSSSTNAFSGRSPSLNLLLNGTSTRIQGATGMNAQTAPKPPMNNVPQGVNNGPQGMNNGPLGMNNGPQGMSSGPMGGGINRPLMGLNMTPGGTMTSQGSGMVQQQLQPKGIYDNSTSMMKGQQQQQMQLQQQPNNRMMMYSRNNSSGSGMMSPGSPVEMQGQGMGQSMGQGMGQSMGKGMGQVPAFSMGNSVTKSSTSGATSSLTGGSVARGVPSSNAPKSSLDTINWKM